VLEERRVNMPVDLALHTSAELLTADAFAHAGLRLDAFGYGDTLDFIMDNL